MDKNDIIDFFAPVARVLTKRMFGGSGIYHQGLIIAFEDSGAFYFKTDAENRALFEDAGAKPFIYTKKNGEQSVMSYFSLPDAACDDHDELRKYISSSLAASRRAEALKPPGDGKPKWNKAKKDTARAKKVATIRAEKAQARSR